MVSISPRVLLTDFTLANLLYANASISVFEADTATWQARTTLAPLYRAASGSAEHGNPLRLDSDGKFSSPVYVDRPVISRVTGAIVPSHDTGIAGLQPAFRGAWVVGEDYNIADVVRDGPNGKLYIAAESHQAEGTFAEALGAGVWQLYVDASTPVDYTDVVTQAQTGFFFASEGARINRMADRLFLGAAVLNDGSSFGGGVGADWFSAGTGVSAGVGWVHYAASVALTVPSGRVGFAAASRASDVPADYGSTQTSIPFVGIAVMDRTGGGPPYWTGYAGYFEARMEGASFDTGTVIGIEIDAVNFGVTPAGQPTPSRMQTLGGATALWLASGGDPSSHERAIGPAQLAIGIIPNTETFEVGIAFHAESIEGTDGTTGFGPAIRMATRHMIDWWAPGGGPSYGQSTTFITSTATEPVHSLQFQDGGTLLVTPDGKVAFSVSNVDDSVNGVRMIPSVAGQPAQIQTFGDDANVTMLLKPQGTAAVETTAGVFAFMSGGGNVLGYVQSSVSDTALANALVFGDGGPFLFGRGATIAGFAMVANAVSYLQLSNAAAGGVPALTALGAGDIDILLDPAGTNGTLRLAVPTASSATAGGASALPGDPAGYWLFKDSGGSVRRTPYYN
jgi:hypothetical protein